MIALIINCSPVRTGATAEIVKTVAEQLSARYEVRSICIDDYSFAFCRGCRTCHNTAQCVMNDAAVIQEIMDEYDKADIVVSVSPSYWADIPGQFKAFIDLAGTGLQDSLRQNLHASRFLIVICSPSSAASSWVNEEVQYFVSQGHIDKIITFIVDGEPKSDDPALECFPYPRKMR